MSAVWRVSRAAIRRRRMQTAVIGVVVAVSTATIVVALALLSTASAPYDRAHAQQHGAHLVAAFDAAAVSNAQLTSAAKAADVESYAGPYSQVTLEMEDNGDHLFFPTLTVVGRANPDGAVDRLNLWQGRWASKPGEIVMAMRPGDENLPLGTRLSFTGHSAMTVVGFAYSVTGSADAWVTPGQMTELKPTATQMLYRFTSAATDADVRAGEAAVTVGLPKNAVLGAQSYLSAKKEVASETAVYVPFLMLFGVLGLVVAVLIVANVISGAVVAGYRDIGMLKALGFSPNQVMVVYLVMVTVPSVVGSVLGTIGGNVGAQPLLSDVFAAYGGSGIGVDLWVDALALVGMPVVVVLAALLSALRARWLPAARAISAGSAPRGGRALRVQRWLSGVRLPRSVSLGLGVPFARPARSGLTLAAVVLGVMTVTLAIGVTMSINTYQSAVNPSHPDRVELGAMTGEGPRMGPPGESEPAQTPPKLSDSEDEALLRSLPGTVHVAAIANRTVNLTGGNQRVEAQFVRGDGAATGPQVLSGHWPSRAGEIAVSSRFLNQRGLAMGDTLTIELDDQRVPVRIVGMLLINSDGIMYADWATLERLAPDQRADQYVVDLAPGTDQQAYLNAVQAGDPGLNVLPALKHGSDQATVLISAAAVLTLVLGIVAALGVFNTVVLNARERRRDLGMLKSIGMTPGQVVTMMVTSMGALGVVGGLIGLPLGVAAHQLLAPAMMRAGHADVLDVVVDVYRAPMFVPLALAGVAIAVLGAFIPARSAARTTIAEALRNE
ncbi:FtsX-like permease family protein [Actinophytocola sp.]|uniref:ABC transporter permease n=1 Tax=Actinophytocola sp. TaxID=1872138 RepID=UPI002ED585FD